MKPARKATYADLVAVPDRFVAEILEGELFTSPRPASPHARAATSFGSAIFNQFDGPPGSPEAPGGWWILNEPELHLGEDVLVPDVAGWRRERMPELPDIVGFTLVPDWVCEVISPSTARIDRGRKMKIYARESVVHLWIVDPLVQTVECYRLENGSWIVDRTHAGDGPLRAAPFDAVEINVARCWSMR
jgi:Uma2 family endonuclease